MNRIKNVIKIIVNEPDQIPVLLGYHHVLDWLPDKYFIALLYYCKTGQKLDLNNPVTLNEKLQWLKIYDRNPAYTQMVDKYEARTYLAEKVGREYLVPLIAVYDKVEAIDFDQLPDQFVLKCNHDSGGNIICADKSKLDIAFAKNKLNHCLRRNYYYGKREWPYKDVKPRIVCEAYLWDEATHDLKDYKVFCFHGQPRCCSVCSNRYSAAGMNMDFYDLDWKHMDFGSRTYPNSGAPIPPPKNYAKMLEFAARLSQGIPFVRVDFYDVNGKLYMGELTLCPCSGYDPWTPDADHRLLGSWIELPPRV